MKLRLIQVQTTPHCNAACVFCPHKHSIIGSMKGFMDKELYESILEKISNYDKDFKGRFCPYLMNEPFVDKRLEDLVELSYKYLPNMELEISTNGELLTKKRAEKLIDIITTHNKNPRTKIKISLHGINKEMIKHLMNINGEKIIQNLKNLIEYNNNRVRIVIFGLGYSRDDNIRYFNARQYKRFLYNELGEFAKNIEIKYGSFHTRAGNVTMENWKYRPKVREIDKNHPFDCSRLHGMLHILYDGSIIPCCMSWNLEYLIANIKDYTIEEIFNLDKYKKFIDMATGKLDSLDDFICKRCDSPGG